LKEEENVKDLKCEELKKSFPQFDISKNHKISFNKWNGTNLSELMKGRLVKEVEGPIVIIHLMSVIYKHF
jgi:hypothetical protein